MIVLVSMSIFLMNQKVILLYSKADKWSDIVG